MSTLPTRDVPRASQAIVRVRIGVAGTLYSRGLSTVGRTDDPGSRLEAIRLEETTHYQITRGILDRPEQYWHHLLAAPADSD